MLELLLSMRLDSLRRVCHASESLAARNVFARGFFGLLAANLRQQIWVPEQVRLSVCVGLSARRVIPALGNIRMAFDSVHERSFSQMIPPSLPERKLHVVLPPSFALENVLSQIPDMIGHRHRLEGSIVADALEEGYREACSCAVLGSSHECATVRRKRGCRSCRDSMGSLDPQRATTF